MTGAPERRTLGRWLDLLSWVVDLQGGGGDSGDHVMSLVVDLQAGNGSDHGMVRWTKGILAMISDVSISERFDSQRLWQLTCRLKVLSGRRSFCGERRAESRDSMKNIGITRSCGNGLVKVK